MGIFIKIEIKDNKANYIEDSDYLYDLAINHLIDQDSREADEDHLKEGYHFFVKHEPLGIVEEGNLKYVYMWVLASSYYLNNDEPKELSSYSIFHKFTFKDDDVTKVEIPRDGSYYTDSVKGMCADKEMENKVLKNDFKLSLDDEVKDYYKDNKYTFKAHVIENKNNDTVLVEVIEDGNLFKKGDKVLVHITNYEVINVQYIEGMDIDIAFDGNIEESNPPKVSSSNVSIVLGKE